MRRHLRDHKKEAAFRAGLVAFLASFVIQVFFNRFVTTVRSLPDEMGAIYLAAHMSGYDWGYLMTHSNRYYGSIMFPLLYPWFKLIKNPYTLYQFLLGTGSLLRCLPALYAADLVQRQPGEKGQFYIILVSMAAVFITPTRGVNIDNEPPIIFLCWTVFYLLARLQEISVTKRIAGNTAVQKTIFTVLLALTLGISLLAHTRAVIFMISIVMTLVVCRLFSGRWLVHIPLFGGTCTASSLVSFFIINYWKETLYRATARAAQGAKLGNTGGSLVRNVVKGVAKSTGVYGIRSFLDLLCGNIYVIFVFSGGLIVAGFVYIAVVFVTKSYCSIAFRKKITSEDTLYLLLYSFFGVGLVILGLCVTWLGDAVKLHTNSALVSHGHFYLRYYGMFFGPLFISLVLSFSKNYTKLRETFIPLGIFVSTVVIGLLSYLYCMRSFLKFSVAKERQSDAFYNFAPLSFSFKAFPNQIQDGGYYLRSFLSAVALLCILHMLLKKRKWRSLFAVILALLLYQYAYIVILWDHPITSMDHFSASSDGIYRLWEEHERIFKKGDTLYQLEQSVAMYTTQFAMQDLKVVNKVPPDNQENVIVLMDNLEKIKEYKIDSDQYRMFRVDQNEILLLRGEEILERFAQDGLQTEPCIVQLNPKQ